MHYRILCCIICFIPSYIIKISQNGCDFMPLNKLYTSQKAVFWTLLVLVLSIGSFFLAAPRLAKTSSEINQKRLPIYCVDTKKPQIALSFDAAWGNEDTQEILSILKKHNIHVTFFLTGGWVDSYPEDVKTILANGHDLGNHSEHHKNMSQLSEAEMKEEIMSVHQKVKELTGYDMFLFRPPYGDYNNQVIATVNTCGYYPIQWSVDSLDWKDYGREDIINRVCENKHLENGAIILCHNGAKYTAKALDDLLTKLTQAGYQIVPISQLIYREKYHMNLDGKQIPDE